MHSRGSPVGYLFTDIEGSTERWEKTQAQMQLATARLDAIIDGLIARHGGVIHDRAGDGVFAIFRDGNPLQCALDMQLEIQRHDWSAVGGLYVRVGVHAGRTWNRAAVNRASRIVSSGWGGQIVVSGAARDLFEAPVGSEFADLGICHFKGIDEPLHLSGLVHPELDRTEFPPLRSLLVHNVSGPAVDGPMFGRDRELSQVLAMLASERLVTLIGAGGNGKTRLAAQASAEHAAKHPSCFVSLDSVTGDSELVSALANALRLPFYGPLRPEDQTIDYLRDRRMLLVLDNADGIAGRASFIDLLIAACPQITVLATSREPLGIAGEALFRLPGIALPSLDAHDVETSPAVQLFVHEARRKGSDFTISTTQRLAFREICRLVDGSPLALRLIARWTNVLSLEEILGRLHVGPDFLSSHEREDTLRGVFEGSWGLLTQPQRLGLARLSVFTRTFDWDAASRVAQVDLDTFAALERKGLIERTADRHFALHSLTRAYAREKFEESPSDAAATRDRHAAHYFDQVRASPIGRSDRAQSAPLEDLIGAFPEIAAAWRHAVEANAKPRILKVIEPLCRLLYTRSMFREGVTLFRAETGDDELRRYFAAIYANFLVHQGDARAAASAASEALTGPGEAGAHTIAHAHHALGNLAHMRGDFDQARSHYERALDIRTNLGDLVGCCYTDISLAALNLMVRRSEEARFHVSRGFMLARQTGDAFGMMAAHVYAGEIAAAEQRLDDAQSNYESGLRLEESLSNPQFRSMLYRRLGSLSVLRGDYEAALGRHREAMELAQDIGDQRTRAQSHIEVGSDFRLLNRLDEAKDHLLLGIRSSLALGLQPSLVRGLLELALVELKLGNMRVARRLASVLDGADLGDMRSAYAGLIAELADAEPDVAPMTIQDMANEIIGAADMDPLKLL